MVKCLNPSQGSTAVPTQLGLVEANAPISLNPSQGSTAVPTRVITAWMESVNASKSLSGKHGRSDVRIENYNGHTCLSKSLSGKHGRSDSGYPQLLKSRFFAGFRRKSPPRSLRKCPFRASAKGMPFLCQFKLSLIFDMPVFDPTIA